MKSALKTKVLSVLIACAVLFGTMGFFNIKPKIKTETASASASDSSGYYYNQLSDLSKKFYGAIHSMNTSGTLKTGKGSYDLIANNIVSSSDVASYAKGDSTMLVAFEAGKNAYYLDHPEVFYVDFDLLSVSLGRKTDGTYSAVIDGGRLGSYFAAGFSETNLQEALDFYNGSNGISSLIPVEESLTTIEKIEYVNSKLIERTSNTYSSGENSLHINSIYGVLKFNVSIAEGYARSFKACMDKLGIDCVQVNGYLSDEDSFSFEAHVWNYVKLDNGGWYAVDVALNDRPAVDDGKYLFLGAQSFYSEHLEDCMLSDSGYKFVCPTLATNDLEFEKLKIEQVYDVSTLTLKIAYNEKNASKLLVEDGLYVVVYRLIQENGILFDSYAEAVSTIYPTSVSNEYSNVTFYPDEKYIRVGVTKVAPMPNGIYSNLQTKDLIASQIIENQLYGTEVEIIRPQATVSVFNETTNETYSNAGNVVLKSEEVWKITLNYNKDLKKLNESANVGVNVSSFKASDVGLYSKVENVEWSETNPRTISFTFKPSALYGHSNLSYIFMPTNLIDSDTSTQAEPMSVSMTFAKSYVSCSKIFEDGRLLLKAYGKPTLIDNKDLDLAGDRWKDSNGNVYVNEQRSEFVLVSTKPSTLTSSVMISQIKETFNIESGAILSNESFELSLNVCGEVHTIPKGSFYKVAFGFPQGYNYNSLKKGVTFKVYHFPKDIHGNIDYENPIELDCAVSEYGLIVTLDTVGQIAIVAADKSKVDSLKTIYARMVNAGGSVVRDNATNQRKMVETIEKDGQLTYTINTLQGYKLDYVLLNGKDVTKDVESGKLTLKESKLNDNNTLDVAFVSQEVYDAEQEAGVTNLNIKFAENQNVVQINPAGGKGLSALAIVLIVVGSVIVVAGVVVAVILVLKKKKNGDAKTTTKQAEVEKTKNSKTKTNKTESVKKTEVKKTVEKKTTNKK